MNEIMKTLFYALEMTKRGEAEERAFQESRAVIEAVQQRLTSKEFDQLWDAISDIDQSGGLDSFTRGFRLGVQLTLEGLRPVS